MSRGKSNTEKGLRHLQAKLVEPEDVTQARTILHNFDNLGVCPSISTAKHMCVWTCSKCRRSIQPTVQSHIEVGQRLTVRCPLAP